MEESCILDKLRELKDTKNRKFKDLEENELALIIKIECLEDDNEILKDDMADLEAEFEDLQDEYELLENEIYELRDAEETRRNYEGFLLWLKRRHPCEKAYFDELFEEYSSN